MHLLKVTAAPKSILYTKNNKSIKILNNNKNYVS